MMELVVVGLWVFIAAVSAWDAGMVVRRLWVERDSTTQFQTIVIVFLIMAIIVAWLFG